MKKLLLLLALLLPISGMADPLPGIAQPLKYDTNGNILPELVNGNPLNLPVDTTLNGQPIGLGTGSGDVISDETAVEDGDIPVFSGTGGKHLRVGTATDVFKFTDDGVLFFPFYDTVPGTHVWERAIPSDAFSISGVSPNKVLDVFFSGLNFEGADYQLLPGLQDAIDANTGSFLSANTARVNPSGDDGTGTIGDLSKPFATVQAAIDAAEALPIFYLAIDIGAGQLSEDLNVTSLSTLTFIGQNISRSAAFNSLTTAKPDFKVVGVNVTLGSIDASSSSSLQVELTNAACGEVVSTGAATVGIFSTVGACQIANVTAAGQVELDGGILYGETISAPGFPIYVVHSHPIGKTSGSTNYYGALIIDSAGSEVFVTDSVLQSVLAAGTLHLKDSRVVGTNNASSTAYEDVLLVPHVDASGFNGNLDTGDDTFQAVAQKVDDLTLTGGVSSVTGTAPIISSGGATPAISMAASTNSVDGYLTAADHTTFNGKQATLTLGTGVLTALGVNIGSAGAFVTNGGALGTPSSGTGTNITGIPEGGLSTTDITTNNVTTSKHGFAPKLPNDATKYLDGTGAYTVPAGGGSGAPTTATYITETADAGLSAEFAMGSLASGLVKNTTTTGVPSIAAPGTDYVAPGGALGTPSSGNLANATGYLPPATTGYVRDDFIGGNVANTTAGEIGWGLASSGAGTTSALVTGEASHPGIHRIDAGSTASSYRVLSLNSNGFLPSDTFDGTFIFRTTSGDTISGGTRRVGFANNDTVNPPTDGIYLEQLSTDTNWFFVTRAASSQTRVDTTVASAAATWYKLRIRRIDGTHVGFTINAGTESSFTATTTALALRPWIQVIDVSAQCRLEIDYFDLLITGLTR